MATSAHPEGLPNFHHLRGRYRSKAQISGEPIFTYDPTGHGAQDFEALTQEVLRNG